MRLLILSRSSLTSPFQALVAEHSKLQASKSALTQENARLKGEHDKEMRRQGDAQALVG